MNIVRKLGDRYKLLSGYETVNLIEKAIESQGGNLTPHQKRQLQEAFGNSGIRGNLDMPFLAYAWEEEDVNGTFPWRLTYPLFIVYSVVLLFVVLPVKWLVTGKYHLPQTSWIARFGVAWYNKITNRCWSE